MEKVTSRVFRDQRDPDKLISEEDLKREYGQLIAGGNIDPAEQSFSQYLFNCMEVNGGTLAEVLPDKEEKAKFTFMIRETLTMTVTIGANSYDEAREKVEEAYNNGEYNLDHNCFAGTEFLPCCSRCETSYSDEEDELREVDTGTPLAMMLCDWCVANMEESGELTRCECCEDVFHASRLIVNPTNGEQEMCPLCGEVWCE